MCKNNENENKVSGTRSPSTDLLCEKLWVAYGPSRLEMVFDNESAVGPTDTNDVAGPLCIVSGDTPEESLTNAKRIAGLLNKYGLQVT